MAATKTFIRPILRREAIGFSFLVALCWVVEFIQLPHLLFGEAAEFNWTRVLLRTVVVLAIGVWVHFTTKSLLDRLHHLEEFLLICSWCRKLGYKGQWVMMEEYFGTEFATKTSHGICPACSQEHFDGYDLELDELQQPFGVAVGERPAPPSVREFDRARDENAVKPA